MCAAASNERRREAGCLLTLGRLLCLPVAALFAATHTPPEHSSDRIVWFTQPGNGTEWSFSHPRRRYQRANPARRPISASRRATASTRCKAAPLLIVHSQCPLSSISQPIDRHVVDSIRHLRPLQCRTRECNRHPARAAAAGSNVKCLRGVQSPLTHSITLLLLLLLLYVRSRRFCSCCSPSGSCSPSCCCPGTGCSGTRLHSPHSCCWHSCRTRGRSTPIPAPCRSTTFLPLPRRTRTAPLFPPRVPHPHPARVVAVAR